MGSLSQALYVNQEIQFGTVSEFKKRGSLHTDLSDCSAPAYQSILILDILFRVDAHLVDIS